MFNEDMVNEATPSLITRLKASLVTWLLSGIHIKDIHFGDHTITVSPTGVGDIVRWSATQAAVALGDLGMNQTTGRPSVFIGGSARNIRGEHEVIRPDGGVAFAADQAMGGFKLTGLGNAVADTDVPTYKQAKDLANQLDAKASCRLATDAALPAVTAGAGPGIGKTLTRDAAGVLTVDGLSVLLNDRVLVKNQVAGADNGIYKCTTEGTALVIAVLTRATDFDENAEVSTNALVGIDAGTVNIGSTWRLTTAGVITVDTTALTFAKFEATFDHGTLADLTADDHTQYAKLAGRATGQQLDGGTAASDSLTLQSTTHATKGFVQISVGSKLKFLGDDQLLPTASGQVDIGTDALKIKRVRAVEVATGDLVMKNEDGTASWRMIEKSDHIVARNENTGVEYILSMRRKGILGWLGL